LEHVNKLVQGLKARFKLSDEAVTKMMKMASVVIKKDATLSEAQRYKEALEAIGAKVQLEPIEEASIEEAEGQPQQTEGAPSSLDREPQVIPVKEKTRFPSPEPTAHEEKTGPQMITCPQCGFEQVATDECTRCGVIIGYKEALEAIGAKVQLEPIEEASIEEAEGQPQQTEGAPSSLDREPQVIPVKEKTRFPSPEPTAHEEKTGPQMITCPQCGFEQVATDECTRCGVIISKFLKYQAEVKPLEAEGGTQGTAGTSTAGPQPQGMIGTPMAGPSSSVPWEDMASLGFLAAFFRTMKEVLLSPTVFFKRMPVNKGLSNPLFYGVIISFFATSVGLIAQYAFSGFIGSFSQVEGMQGVSFFQTAFFLIYVLLLPIIIAVGLFILSAIFHICLLIVGAGKQGFEATFRVVAYASSTQAFALVPFLGGFIILIYNLALWTIGFRESQRTTTGRAFIAVLLPVVIILFIIGLIVFTVVLPLIFSQQGQVIQQEAPPSF
jgi:ribosomal protein L32/ribosomal protein L37E